MVTVELTVAVIVPVEEPIESLELEDSDVDVPGTNRSNVQVPPVIET